MPYLILRIFALWAVNASVCVRAGYEYDGAVMITASHLPYNRNGFKFFTRDGGFEKGDVSQLLQLAAAEHAAEDAPHTRPGDRYTDDAFVLASALHTDPGLIDYVRPSVACPTSCQCLLHHVLETKLQGTWASSTRAPTGLSNNWKHHGNFKQCLFHFVAEAVACNITCCVPPRTHAYAMVLHAQLFAGMHDPAERRRCGCRWTSCRCMRRTCGRS